MIGRLAGVVGEPNADRARMLAGLVSAFGRPPSELDFDSRREVFVFDAHQRVALEEVLAAILVGDEAEASLGDEAGDGSVHADCSP